MWKRAKPMSIYFYADAQCTRMEANANGNARAEIVTESHANTRDIVLGILIKVPLNSYSQDSNNKASLLLD